MTRSRPRRPSCTLGALLCCTLGVLVALHTDAGWAAERCVFVEDFTATWCTYCPEASLALIQLESEYPGAVITLQIHYNDAPYSIPWCTTRWQSYPNHPGMPDVWFDGVLQHLGAPEVPVAYAFYLDMFNTRQAVPTDVTIEIGGVQVNGPTYTLQARVCLEQGGVPKTVRVYIARALDHYPTGNHYRNCVREVAPTEDINLLPGECQTIERTVTFDTTSWSRQSDIRIFAWAQVPDGVLPNPREVYQSALAAWPLAPLPPLYLLGDLNCDGSADFNDLNPFVLYVSNLSEWQATYPGCAPKNGDINDDGSYPSFEDINPFVALLTEPP
jgi:thiol-disulfide isomerase/thioredoxin